MLIAVLISFVIALLAPLVHRWNQAATGWLLALLPAGLFAYFASFVPQVMQTGAVREVTPWVPSFGVNLSFWLDGLSLLFVLLITGLGALIVAYAGGYLKGDKNLGRFYLFLLLFMSAMLGLVLADNLITLFVFWELTSITSYLLIGYKHTYEDSRKSALQALLVTGTGGLALLAGLLLMSVAGGGTFELSEIIAQGDAIREHSLYLPIFVLIALGAFTKSAQFPFHFWLPNAMAAPTPVSAFLHSATMVKAGIYLLARVDGVLGGTEVWTWTLSIAGSLTMLIGATMALRQTDLKKILAYSTITALGTLTVMIGLSFGAGIKAAIVFLVVHSLYKGALFMVAGSVDHETGTRNVLQLGGLGSSMPITRWAAVFAGLSMAGLPPLFGFIGKELSYKAKLGFDGADIMLPGVAVLANAMTVIAAALIVLRPFFGTLKPTPRTPHETPASMWLGPAVLGVAGLLFGLFPNLVANSLIGPAVEAILGKDYPIDLSLWYGFNTALLLSAITMLAGIGGYFAWDRIRTLLAKADPLRRFGPESGYFKALDGLVWFAKVQTKVIQNGSLRFYLFTMLTVIVGLLGVTLFVKGGLYVPESWPQIYLYEGVLMALIAAAAVAIVVATSRLAAVTALGVAGFSIALLFIVLGAPDLAMTQFLVETLIVVIIVLVMQRLPRFSKAERSSWGTRLRDGALAGTLGLLVAAIMLAVLQLPLDMTVPDYLANESVPSGKGRNIVNVILVDFRALDTLGEIAVIAVAAIGAYALLRLGKTRSKPAKPTVSA